MQITSNAGWKHVGLGCKLREHCQVRSICTCSIWQSLQTGPKELSECPGDEGNRAIKSSPPAAPLATVTGETEHTTKGITGPLVA